MATEPERKRAVNGLREFDAPETAVGIRLHETALRTEAVEVNGASLARGFGLQSAESGGLAHEIVSERHKIKLSEDDRAAIAEQLLASRRFKCVQQSPESLGYRIDRTGRINIITEFPG